MDFLDLGCQSHAVTLFFCSPDPGGGGAHLWARPQPAAGDSRCRHSQPPSPGVQDLPGTDPSLCQDLLTKGKLHQGPAPSFGLNILSDPVKCHYNHFSSFSSLPLCRCWRDWSRLGGSHRPNILMFSWWQQTSLPNARRWVPSSGSYGSSILHFILNRWMNRWIVIMSCYNVRF